MTNVAIIASGHRYQDAAGLAASTYRAFLPDSSRVAIFIPRKESVSSFLAGITRQYSLEVIRFDFRLVERRKFTAQLKCQGFVKAIKTLAHEPKQMVLLVDADTFCQKPISFEPPTRRQVLAGRIGMTPDIANRYVEAHNNPDKPWYVPPKSRLDVYLNSGVILASRKGLDMFLAFEAVSMQREFLRGRYNDQRIINYLLCTRYQNRLVVLPSSFNGLFRRYSKSVIIGHIAGGAGRFGRLRSGKKFGADVILSRQELHRQVCETILERQKSTLR